MVAGGSMLIPTAFAPLSIVSVWKIYIGMGGYNAARGLISRDIDVSVSTHKFLALSAALNNIWNFYKLKNKV